MDGQPPGTPFDSVAHIIQTSLAPVFLLTGVATLLNTLATRLARVSDVQRHVAEQLERAQSGSDRAELLKIALRRLQQRSAILITALVSGTTAGAATCGAILTLFVGALSNRATASVLFALFGIAVVCTMGALVAFLAETVLSWYALRVEATFARQRHLIGILDT